MRNKINLSKKINLIVSMVFFFFLNNNCSNAQDFSNGIIDFVFQPGSGAVQTVVWIEDESGNYIETVFITNFIGRNGGGNRTDNPDIDYSAGNRLSAFPVWAHKRNVIDTTYGIDNLYPPSASQPSYPADMDAVSGATPNTDVQTKTLELSDLEYGEYECWIEVNRSFDFNEYHEYSSYRGQPSLVWNVNINVGDNPDSSTVLDYTGYGSPDGSDGDISAPDSTITTAENLLAEMEGYKFKVVYTPDLQGVDDSDSLSPAYSFFLGQNYPNPFNASTAISYSIARSAFVVLKAYDALGNEVKTLVSKFQAAGEYEFDFDAKDLSAGVYFYRLNVDGALSEPKKMLFVR
jgi:hypothetical protein